MRGHLRRLPVFRARLGDPKVRDPGSWCDEFEPGEPHELGQCMTDGHYLCEECVHISPEALAERREED